MTQGVQDLRLIKDVIMREIRSQGEGAPWFHELLGNQVSPEPLR